MRSNNKIKLTERYSLQKATPHYLYFIFMTNITLFFLFFISINQIDTCHTTNISKGGWFIRLFKKHLKLTLTTQPHQKIRFLEIFLEFLICSPL